MNLPLYFNYSVKDIKSIEKNIINKYDDWIFNIKNNNDINAIDFLNSYLYNISEYDYIYGSIKFLKHVSPNKDIRDASSQFEINIKEYFLNFFKSYENYKLFLILKKIKLEKNNNNNQKKLIKNILKSFEDNGAILNKGSKKKFIKYEEDLIFLENIFSENIINDIKNIKYQEEELKNVDDNILLKHKVKDYYIFDTSYPDEKIIMGYCSISNSRKKMSIIFNSVAKENLNILKKIIRIRYKISNIFGHKDFVSYMLSYNRLATLKEINYLLGKLIPILKEKANKEYNELLKISGKKYLYDYDISYYSNMYKKKFLNIDEQKIKEYFPSNYTIDKIIKIYADLFCINIKKIKGDKNQYWNENVDLYIVNDNKDGKKLGYFYLDLYPRYGKFTHAATFEIQNTYRNVNDIRILPITAIVCNFTPINNKNNIALFTFSEIVTFCHEFGHGLHNILSNVKYVSLSGISMENDFAETPSQFFEFWCFNNDFLRKISRHYITKKSLPDNIITNIKKNKSYNIGLHFLTQILYIKYDLIIHHQKYINKKYLHDIWFDICNDLLPFKILKKSYPMCRFDHLMGYEVGYYGYLWSIIYAYDAFSLFEENGIFNKSLGKKFRKEILEKGGTVNAKKMLENFLGRKTSNKSFFDSFVKL
jgi:Zn-dependent oligopeptidase